MATMTTEKALVLTIPPEILGPSSEYEKRRLALKSDTDTLIANAKRVTVVNSPETLETANNAGRTLQAASKEIEVFFKPVKSAIDALKKPVLAAENAMAAEVDTEKRRLGGLITTYNMEQERKRQEEQRKAEEEARKAAEDARLEDAAMLAAAGDDEGAEQLLEEPIAAPVVIQQEAPVKQAGQVGRMTYKCKVNDVKALMKAVLEGKAPSSCFTLDQGWLDKKAALDKEGFDLPGCELQKIPSTHFRA